MPRPWRGRSPSSSGRSRYGVIPAACSVGQKRLLGPAKLCPISADRRPGLTPQKRIVRPGAMIGASSGIAWATP